MRHAGAATLALLAPLLSQIRELSSLAERKPGAFYLRSTAFLHFHEDPQGLFADVKLDGSKFQRFAVDTPEEQAALLLRLTEALAVASAPTSAKGRSSSESASPEADEEELRATVQRMEKRLALSTSLAVQALMAHYAHLSARFEKDLATPREVLLARASALMLIQSVAQAENAA